MSKISELSDGGALQSTDYLIAVRSGGNVKVRPNGAVSGTTGTFSDDLNVGSGKLFVDVSGGNVGIGTSSPEDPLHVAGDIRTDNASYIVQETSTGGAVRMLGINAGNTAYVGPIDSGPTDAIFNASSTSNTSAFYTAGTERMRIDSSGRVGIGTSSPGYKLSVSATGNISGEFRTSGAINALFLADAGTTAETLYIGTVGNDFRVVTGSNERMRIDSAGNVGIGTTSPTYALDVFTTASSIGGRITTNTSGSYLSFLDNGGLNGYVRVGAVDNNLVMLAGNAERMRITSAGNVGIGVSSPLVPLHVQTSSGSPWFLSKNSTDELYVGVNTSFNLPSIESNTAIRFATGGSFAEAARIDSSGNLLVGTTTTAFDNSNSVAISASQGYVLQNHVLGTGSGTKYTYFSYNAGEIGSITQNGTTGVSYNTSSDQRLKENITDANDAGDKIDAIQVRQFDWKADGAHQDYGMIAQELLTVAPEAVSGDPESDDMMGVDYSKLVPMLVKEIQSLRARVAQLEGA